MRNRHKITLKLLRFVILTISLVVYQNTFIFSQSGEDKTLSYNFNLPFEECWNFSGNQKNEINFASDNAFSVYLPLLEGKLLSLNSDTGKKRWESHLGSEIISTPSTDSTSVYVVVALNNYESEQNGGSSGGEEQNNAGKKNKKEQKLIVRSLDKLTGLTIWQSSINTYAPPDIKAYTYLYKDSLFVATSEGGVHSIDKASGRIMWTKNLNLMFSSVPYFADDRIFIGTADSRVIIFSLITGVILEEINSLNRATVIASDNKNRTGNTLFWGDKKGSVVSLNIKDRKTNWRFRAGGEISSLAPIAKGLFITSFDNFVYLISYKTGNLIWKKRLDGRNSVQPTISENYAIITAISEPAAIVIELNGGKTVNKLTLDPENFFTGHYAKSQNSLIYSTYKGIFAFAPNGQCPNH